ncbi:MAG: SDR family NAD(P)-dependent oxidoreductase [Pseudomonadota bacterium]
MKGRTVLVTGGATGIGAQLVTDLAAQGCQVAFIDLADAEGQALAAAHDAVSFYACDVTDVAALKATVATIGEHHGAITGLLNNVGNDTRHAVADVTEAFWRRCMAVNLDAAFFTSQAVLPQMQAAGGGSIVNLGSINALLGPDNMVGYVTAKAGLMGMTRSMAREVGADRIRVNALLPGWVVTDRQLEKWLTPEAEAAWMAQVSIQRRLLPDDVGRLALFLLADDSEMITGQTINVDGGRT